MSFRSRLTLAYLLLLTLTLTAFGLGVYTYVDRRLHAELYGSVLSQGRNLGQLLHSYETAANVKGLLQGQSGRGQKPDTYIQVRQGTNDSRKNWVIEAKYPDTAMQDVTLPRAPNGQIVILAARRSPLGSPLALYTEEYHASRRQRLAGREAARLPADDTTTRGSDDLYGEVTVARSLEGIESSLRLLRTILIGGGLAVLLTAALLGSVLAGALMRPLARMRSTAQQIGDERDFTRRLPVEGNPGNPRDELARLSLSFNQMLTELERSHLDLQTTLDAQRRFVADASHELRTPITAIRTNVEFLSRVPDARPEDRTAAIHDVLTEMRRMESLVGDLLALARLEGAARRGPRRAFRLDHLLADIHRDAVRQAPDEVMVRLGVLPEAWVLGERDDLRRAIWNLADNALKYTRTGWIELSLTIKDGLAAIRVADTGIGIAEADLGRVFDRFWRAPGVRGMAGSGLGLAITRWVADLHRGAVTVESTLGRGTTFTLELPVTTRRSVARRLQREAEKVTVAS